MEAVHRFARDSARTPMQWNSSENAGFSTNEPWLPVYDDYAAYNVAAVMEDADSVLNWDIKLSHIRAEHEELVAGDYQELFHDSEQIFAYTRSFGGKTATVLINLSGTAASYDAACIEGAELLIGTNGSNEKGRLAPYEAVIYSS